MASLAHLAAAALLKNFLASSRLRLSSIVTARLWVHCSASAFSHSSKASAPVSPGTGVAAPGSKTLAATTRLEPSGPALKARWTSLIVVVCVEPAFSQGDFDSGLQLTT